MNRVRVGLSTVRGASVPFPAGGKARVVAVDIDLAALQTEEPGPPRCRRRFQCSELHSSRRYRKNRRDWVQRYIE